MNKHCEKEYRVEEVFGRDECAICGTELMPKQEVKEESKTRFIHKEKSEKLLRNLENFLESIENIKFPKIAQENLEEDQEVFILFIHS